jgi:hypothetical protein
VRSAIGDVVVGLVAGPSDGAGADIADRLDALDLERDGAATERSEDANEV